MNTKKRLITMAQTVALALGIFSSTGNVNAMSANDIAAQNGQAQMILGLLSKGTITPAVAATYLQASQFAAGTLTPGTTKLATDVFTKLASSSALVAGLNTAAPTVATVLGIQAKDLTDAIAVGSGAPGTPVVPVDPSTMFVSRALAIQAESDQLTIDLGAIDAELRGLPAAAVGTPLASAYTSIKAKLDTLKAKIASVQTVTNDPLKFITEISSVLAIPANAANPILLAQKKTADDAVRNADDINTKIITVTTGLEAQVTALKARVDADPTAAKATSVAAATARTVVLQAIANAINTLTSAATVTVPDTLIVGKPTSLIDAINAATVTTVAQVTTELGKYTVAADAFYAAELAAAKVAAAAKATAIHTALGAQTDVASAVPLASLWAQYNQAIKDGKTDNASAALTLLQAAGTQYAALLAAAAFPNPADLEANLAKAVTDFSALNTPLAASVVATTGPIAAAIAAMKVPAAAPAGGAVTAESTKIKAWVAALTAAAPTLTFTKASLIDATIGNLSQTDADLIVAIVAAANVGTATLAQQTNFAAIMGGVAVALSVVLA